MKRLVVSLVALFIIIGAGAIIFNNFYPKQNKLPYDKELIQAITRTFPAYLYKDKPIVEVASVSKYDNAWYDVTIKSLHEVKEFVPVKIVLVDSQDGLHVVLGPDALFTEDQMLQANLPDAVIIGLQKL